MVFMFSSASSLTNKKPSAGSSVPFLILQCLFSSLHAHEVYVTFIQQQTRELQDPGSEFLQLHTQCCRHGGVRVEINPRFNPQNLKYKLCLTQQRVRAQSGGSVYSSISSGVVAAVYHSAFIPACCSINAIDLAASHNICPTEAGKTGVHRAPSQIRPLFILELNEKKCVNILKCSCGSTGLNSGWLAHVVQDVDRLPSSNRDIFSEAFGWIRNAVS